MKSLNTPEFSDLKCDVEAHARHPGYYIIKLLDITELRDACLSEEEIAEKVFREFDDQPWPPDDQRPRDQTWTDYAVSRELAKQRTVDALAAGTNFGHLECTIDPFRAASYFNRFDALFAEPKQYYCGMGFGDRRHVFLDGVAIIARDGAGLLWVVQSD